MAFLDKWNDLAEKAGDLAKTASEKAGETFEATKVSVQVGGIRHQIEETKEKIGDIYWQQYQKDGTLDNEAALILCREIADREDEIAKLQAKTVE